MLTTMARQDELGALYVGSGWEEVPFTLPDGNTVSYNDIVPYLSGEEGRVRVADSLIDQLRVEIESQRRRNERAREENQRLRAAVAVIHAHERREARLEVVRQAGVTRNELGLHLDGVVVRRARRIHNETVVRSAMIDDLNREVDALRHEARELDGSRDDLVAQSGEESVPFALGRAQRLANQDPSASEDTLVWGEGAAQQAAAPANNGEAALPTGDTTGVDQNGQQDATRAQ
jgi:hypothetical protein